MNGFHKAVLKGLRARVAKLAAGMTGRSKANATVGQLRGLQQTLIKHERIATGPRLTLADQWARLDAVLVRSANGSLQAKSLQKAAAQKLDLAQYGLQTLMEDLSSVMTIPGRRLPAPVLVLDVGLSRAQATRPAAHAA